MLPREGTLLWGDRYVVPATSGNQDLAEQFINFLLRPQISAEIVNANDYATANGAALSYVRPDIRDDPAVYPSADVLTGAHFYAPLSPRGEALYAEVWRRFLAARHED